MGDNSEEARARAEAKFQKQQKAAEAGVKATEERAAQARAVDVNTTRLRSLRLAKEAADKEAKAKTKGPAQTKATTTKKRASPCSNRDVELYRKAKAGGRARLLREPGSRVGLLKAKKPHRGERLRIQVSGSWSATRA